MVELGQEEATSSQQVNCRREHKIAPVFSSQTGMLLALQASEKQRR